MKYRPHQIFVYCAIAFAMLASLCVAPTTAYARAVAQKNVQGTFTVNGEETALHHAYSLMQPARDGDQAYTILLLTDKPVPVELVVERFDAKTFAPPPDTQVIEVWLDQSRRTRRVF